jgi:Na+-translocating ferredoxin:NAD+ oxidoreductase RNF subunit RnfB
MRSLKIMENQLLVSLFTMGGLGLILSIGLTIADKRLKIEEDPRIKEIASVLPGLNCGACGFPNCHAYAELVVQGGAGVDSCFIGGREAQLEIAEIMKVQLEEKEKKAVAVCCRGGRRESKKRFRYRGILTCQAANLVNGGDKACVYGCLGFGDCVRACPFSALELNDNGLPVVREENCRGCGLCVKACPRKIISLISQSQMIYLGCISQDKAKAVKEVCTVGCFGCTLCANPKVTPEGLIVMENNLPVIKIENIKDWKVLDQAVVKCPAKCFVVRDVRH